MLTVKQKLMFQTIKKLYCKIHKKTTVFDEQYCKDVMKVTVSEMYKVYPDRNVGKIAINWFDEKFNKTARIDENTFCFEINFFDVYTGLPWLVCRFYKGTSGAMVYLVQ